MVCRARDPRNRRADAARGDGAGRNRRLVPVQPRARHAAAGRIARTGGPGGRGRLCRDARASRTTGRATSTNLRDPLTAKRCSARRQAARAGDTMRNPALAATLRRIGREGREAFYEGAVARDIVDRLKELGGLHEEEDFAAQRSNWVEPIHASYRGYDVYECPPNAGTDGADDPEDARGLCARRRRVQRGRPAAPDRRGDQGRLSGSRQFYRRPRARAGRCRGFPVRGMRRAHAPRRSASTARCRRRTGTGSSTRIRSICASSIATATPCRSSTRCSRPSAPASWRRKAASYCTIAAPASARSRATPTRSRRASGRSTRSSRACWSRMAAR